MKFDYNKSELVETLLERLGSVLECMTASAENARQASVEAPGAMQSRYDSSKEEQGYLADACNIISHQMKRELSGMRFIELPKNPSFVATGCLVRVEDDLGIEDYLILPYTGGEIIETEKGEVIVMTPNAPFAQAMLGLQKGDLGSYATDGNTVGFKIVDLI